MTASEKAEHTRLCRLVVKRSEERDQALRERDKAREAAREIVDYVQISYVSQLAIDLWAERWPWLQEER